MKRILAVVAVCLVLAYPVSAAFFDPDGTAWSVRGNVNALDIGAIHGSDISEVYRGKVNAYTSLQRGEETQGMLFIEARDTNGSNVRFSISWQHKGREYGVSLLEDTNTTTQFAVKARTIWNGAMDYGVDAIVTYHKNTKKMDITGPGFVLLGIDVDELPIPGACSSAAAHGKKNIYHGPGQDKRCV